MIAASIAVVCAIAYVAAAGAFERRRARAWPLRYTVSYVCGLASIVVAIDSPLDRAGDRWFVPHMVQHLILTDVSAPLLLLGAPLLLALGALPRVLARRVVAFMRGVVPRALGYPVVSWAAFVVVLWAVHFGGFFEAALDREPLHLVEHALFIGTAVLFWSPVVAIGPTPWVDGPLGYPLRMFYLLVAMPAEGFLGFAIYGSQHVLYAHYAAAGLADQQAAGEVMWIGSGLAMFVAFMLVAFEWSRSERRLAERADARADRAALLA